MGQRLSLLIIVLITSSIFAQNDSEADSISNRQAIVMPPESGYFVVESSDGAGQVGAAGYTLSISGDGWQFSGWTILAAKASGGEKMLREHSTARLDPAMRLLTYEITLNNSAKLVALYKDGVVRIQSQINREQSDEKTRTKEEDVQSEVATRREKGTAAKSEPIVKDVFEESIAEPPFLLDLNFFPLWAIFAKQIKLQDENVAQNFAILIPQIAKLSRLTANVGHIEMFEDKPVYKVFFSSPEFDATALMDSVGGRLYELDMPKNKMKIKYSKNCPDTLSLVSLDLAKDIEISIPKSNIKCDKMIEEPIKVKYLKANITLDFQGTPRTKMLWQNFDGKYDMGKISGTVEVEMKEYKGSKSWKMSQLHDLPLELAKYISTTPQIPAHNDAVKNLIKEFSGKTIWDFAKSANRWVADRIKQTPDQHDALLAAANHKGDPIARARLFAAIMRTQGIPARVVGGLYYFGQNWVQHYWAEVWVSPSVGWRPVDPSTGEDRNFSAIHITLFENNANIGAGEIDIVKVKK